MSEYPDHDRVCQLLNRIDQITKESELLRRQIERLRHSSPEWPNRPGGVSRLFDEGSRPFDSEASER